MPDEVFCMKNQCHNKKHLSGRSNINENFKSLRVTLLTANEALS